LLLLLLLLGRRKALAGSEKSVEQRSGRGR
jgi:hypothetical protein